MERVTAQICMDIVFHFRPVSVGFHLVLISLVNVRRCWHRSNPTVAPKQNKKKKSEMLAV